MNCPILMEQILGKHIFADPQQAPAPVYVQHDQAPEHAILVRTVMIVHGQFRSFLIFTGRYGSIVTQTAGYFEHLYTTINTVNGVGSVSHCLDLYYYLTDRSNNAKLSIVWTAGLGPTPIASVTAQGDRWERLRQTFTRPLSNYYVSHRFHWQ